MSLSTTNSLSTSSQRRLASTAYGEIAYRETGSGPAAIFIHGVFLNADLWDARSLTLTNCDADENLPPAAFRPVVDLARAGQLAGALPAIAASPQLARASLASSLEHPEAIGDDVLTGFFAPFADPARAAAVQAYVAGMDNAVTVAIRDDLARLQARTLIVWGTGDEFFGLSWAHWLADTIPGTVRLVTVDSGRLFFPLERPAELSQPLRELWQEG
jgi:pimeloyl-ACP methyl ester carboxylesterase